MLRRALAVFGATLGIAIMPAIAHAGPTSSTRPTTGDHALDAALTNGRIVAPRALMAALEKARVHSGIPAFSRQTHLACSACHYQFPELTPFGRLFKLNGYTMTGLQTIAGAPDSNSLKLAPIPPAAAMVVTGMTHLSKAIAGTQNNTADFPQQMSLFLGGQVTPNVGAFTQLTYEGAGGSIGMDNVDVRYATHKTFGDRDVLLGLTVHNNPTVQDVWNTTPAWGYPFMTSSVAPTGAAATLIDGGLAQEVVGVGAYSLYNNMLYTELTAYRSAPQGAAMPADSTATNTIRGVLPYWRVALQHQLDATYVMVGTFGFAGELYPTGVNGFTNRYADVGLDGQIEQPVGTGTLIGRATYIHEGQTLNGSFASGSAMQAAEHLSTTRANISYLPSTRYSVSAGVFSTEGTTDGLLYPPGDVSGSNTGSPNTSGGLAEFTYNAWENTRLGVQYTLYSKFNGATSAYDVPGGRSAGDNNNLYVYLWLAF